MVVFSKLANATSALSRFSVFTVFKRYGHARVITIRGSLNNWNRVKDAMHFYALLSCMVWIGTAVVVNTFIGQCELQDTPEGFEPHYWQYDRHPIQQFMAHYIGVNPMKSHEHRLGHLYHLMQSEMWNMEEDRARRLMFQRQDYRAWYYVPYSNKWLDWTAQEIERNKTYRPQFLVWQ